MNTPVNGALSWKWVAIAACTVVFSIVGAWVNGLQARVADLESRVAVIAVIQRDIAYLRESSDRLEAKLNALLQRRPASAPFLSSPRAEAP